MVNKSLFIPESKHDLKVNERIKIAAPNEYLNYIYSLALFMYKNGFLTEGVKQRALECIDKCVGLELYEESGEKILKERIKVLSEFKEKITSPMPKRKKIKLNVNSNPIFTVGDMIALKLTTDRQLTNNFAGVDLEHITL